eukprot:7380842-Prymnesium_polylepis.1
MTPSPCPGILDFCAHRQVARLGREILLLRAPSCFRMQHARRSHVLTCVWANLLLPVTKEGGFQLISARVERPHAVSVQREMQALHDVDRAIQATLLQPELLSVL